MTIQVFNTSDSVDAILQNLINSDDSEIILYHEGRSNDISSIEIPALCEFYFKLFNAINELSDVGVSAILSKLHEQTIGELFMCDVAHKIYADLPISKQVVDSLKTTPLVNRCISNTSIYESITSVKNAL